VFCLFLSFCAFLIYAVNDFYFLSKTTQEISLPQFCSFVYSYVYLIHTVLSHLWDIRDKAYFSGFQLLGQSCSILSLLLPLCSPVFPLFLPPAPPLFVFLTQLGGLGITASSPSGVQGGAQAKNAIICLFTLKKTLVAVSWRFLSRYKYRVINLKLISLEFTHFKGKSQLHRCAKCCSNQHLELDNTLKQLGQILLWGNLSQYIYIVTWLKE